MKYIKIYITGLLVIGLIVQPYFFGKLIGMNMDFGPLSYFCALFFEVIIVAILYAPYAIGYYIVEETKEDQK